MTDGQKIQKDLEAKRGERKKLTKKAILSLFICIFLIGLTSLLAYYFGEGSNFFKKQLDFGLYHLIALILSVLIARVFILKDKFSQVKDILKDVKDIVC